jgi:hypothetical protein
VCPLIPASSTYVPPVASPVLTKTQVTPLSSFYATFAFN